MGNLNDIKNKTASFIIYNSIKNNQYSELNFPDEVIGRMIELFKYTLENNNLKWIQYKFYKGFIISSNGINILQINFNDYIKSVYLHIDAHKVFT